MQKGITERNKASELLGPALQAHGGRVLSFCLPLPLISLELSVTRLPGIREAPRIPYTSETLRLLSKRRIIIPIIIRLWEALHDPRTGKHLFTARDVVGAQQRVELLSGIW